MREIFLDFPAGSTHISEVEMEQISIIVERIIDN